MEYEYQLWQDDFKLVEVNAKDDTEATRKLMRQVAQYMESGRIEVRQTKPVRRVICRMGSGQ